jgi:hypothetical protein
MRKCYWTGPVSIPKDSVNPDKSDPLDEDCYWNAEIIGIPSTYGVSKTTSEMKQQVTYVGWDFETVWALNALTNQGYPYPQVFLSNEGQPPDGDIPPDGDTPPDGQEPTEGDTPPDGQTPISTPLEGESTIADGETATDDAKPQTMVFSCNTV